MVLDSVVEGDMYSGDLPENRAGLSAAHQGADEAKARQGSAQDGGTSRGLKWRYQPRAEVALQPRGHQTTCGLSRSWGQQHGGAVVSTFSHHSDMGFMVATLAMAIAAGAE